MMFGRKRPKQEVPQGERISVRLKFDGHDFELTLRKTFAGVTWAVIADDRVEGGGEVS
jgi:hypothetical protein